MGNVKDLRSGVAKLREKERNHEENIELMRNTNNWCIVHATKYLPKTNSDGTIYIPTTSMATNFRDSRATLHVTLNHIVESHSYGSWNETPIVVLAPYRDVIVNNGNPVEVSGMDTYWSLNPDKGLILPESAYVVKPDNNGPLFQIGKHGATYKRDNYTDEEIAQIESMLEPYEMAKYTRYKNGDLESWEIRQELVSDKRLERMYESAKDKKSFLRGLFEESRFDILSKYLRDAVVKMSMERMGKSWVDGISDCSEISEVIANTAEADGIPGNPSDKGHTDSVYGLLEKADEAFRRVLEEGDGPHLFETNAKSLYDVIIALGGQENPVTSEIISSLVENKPIDFLGMYRDCYSDIRESSLSSAESQLQVYKENLNFYYSDKCVLDEDSKNKCIHDYRKLIDVYSEFIQSFLNKRTIEEYDQNLWKTVCRHCERLSSRYQEWRERLVKDPEYKNLIQKLRGLVVARSMSMSHGRGE